jgi:DNA invertase Pin-like site-specific DNA recombinase
MISDHSLDKITAERLRRDAYLYVRQSTLRQVMENTTSTDRQYGLRQRAVALGWAIDQVVVIDEDLGRSGASADGRSGFQRLVGDVGIGKAGIVIGLEVSRLARNNADWYRLLEICALTETLILDEDGLYDPCNYNDRLLLGLKGQMSEAELHLLKARLRGGQLSKARTGELVVPLPVGLVYDPTGRVVLDPDQGVRDAVNHLFATFARTGSARATVKAFAQEGLRFPSRVQTGPNKGTLGWFPLRHHRVLQVLHNPRYAGAYCYGRRRARRGVDGAVRYSLQPRESWIVLIPDAHPGYISWADHDDNLRRLAESSQSRGDDRRHSPPREGPALLQGLAVCARCGSRMTVRYHTRRDVTYPEYMCQRRGIEEGNRICQSVPGEALDAAIGELLLATVTPVALDVALAVQAELEGRAAEADGMRRQHVERARHLAEQARRRYLAVDPDNRLVAVNLEADWNDALRALTQAQEDYQHQTAKASPLDPNDKARIAALASDFPALWSDPRTPQRERKRMVRLLIEDVTLNRDGHITGQVRFKGGQTTTVEVTVGLPAPQARRTPAAVIAEIDRLLDHNTEAGVAEQLNNSGILSGTGEPFHPGIIHHIRVNYGLTPREQRLAARGLVNLEEAAERLGVCVTTVKAWHHQGRLHGEPVNRKGEHYYQIPAVVPRKAKGRPPGTKNPPKHAVPPQPTPQPDKPRPKNAPRTRTPR